MDRILANPNPSVGLVIGTYAALPHVHFQLETLRRHHPHVAVLVHDDGSHQRAELEGLCTQYGASFTSTSGHTGRYKGDLSTFLAGFEWARQNGYQYLVKFSLRFIPIKPWLQELQELAYYTQYATYSYLCASTGFGFRTECLAAHLPSWYEPCHGVRR